MAVHGLSTGKTRPFVSTTDPSYRKDGKHADGATIFELRTLDGYTLARLKDLQADVQLRALDGGRPEDVKTEMKMKMFEAAMEACRVGICDWKNFTDDTGVAIDCKLRNEQIGRRQYQVLDGVCVGLIPPDLALEIMQVLMATNTLTAVDEGKSAAAS